MRDDLLALTHDDMALLANRGLLKRALQEIQSGDLSYELEEDAGQQVVVRWSDGVTCELPGGATLGGGRCSCAASGICRHLLRSALAYQQQHAQQAGTPTAPSGPWNPGEIADVEIGAHLSRAALAWARHAFAAGHVVELVRSAKPSATIHSLACTVRFLVPGDLRYTHCDCAEAAPCRHAALAVWAFRLLDAAAASGVVETAPSAGEAPLALLDAIDAALAELAACGLSAAPQPLVERLRRLDLRCREQGLIWPADTLAELALLHAAYERHDARFSPGEAAALVGELCLRADAIRAGTGAVPQLFIRGSASDHETALRSAHLIGLGCSARFRRGGVELVAYMQDAATGAMIVIPRSWDDPADPAKLPPSLWQLAQQPVTRGASLAAFGGGQALARGGRRQPNGSYTSAGQIAVSPQHYSWERLHAPLLAEDFAELSARLAALPPAALRPRVLADGLFVCAVAGCRDASFHPASQEVQATLVDSAGAAAALIHPYTARGRGGAEQLLAKLRDQPETLRFVAGRARLGPGGPVFAPTALVFQDGPMRSALLPWVAPDIATMAALGPSPASQPHTRDPLADYWEQVAEALGELLVVGLARADARMAQRWRFLVQQGGQLGFRHALAPVELLAALLDEKSHRIRWDAAPAASAALSLARVAALAADAVAQV